MPGMLTTQPHVPSHPELRQLIDLGSSGSMLTLQPPLVLHSQVKVGPWVWRRISMTFRPTFLHLLPLPHLSTLPLLAMNAPPLLDGHVPPRIDIIAGLNTMTSSLLVDWRLGSPAD